MKGIKGNLPFSNWSAEQLNLLREKYSTTTWCDLELLFGRGKFAIAAIARKLNLSRIRIKGEHISVMNPERWKEMKKASSERMKKNNPSLIRVKRENYDYKHQATLSGLSRRKNRIKREGITFPSKEEYGYDIGYIYGVIAGDGSLWKDGTISLQAISKEFVDAFRIAVEKVFHLKTVIKTPNREKWNKSTVYEVLYSMKDVSEFIANDFGGREYTLTGTTRAPQDLLVNKEFARGFIAGFFDAEGHRSDNQTFLSNSSRIILEQMKDILLTHWEIESSIYDAGADHTYTLALLGGKEVGNKFVGIFEPKIPYKAEVMIFCGRKVWTQAEMNLLETNQEVLLDRSEISIKKKKWSIKQRKNNASQ